MPPVQTTYSTNSQIAVPGQIDQTFEAREIVSRLTNAAVPMGRGVCISGTAGAKCDLPAAAGDVTQGKVLGVVCFTPAASSTTVPAGVQASILRKGRAWVTVEEAVNDGDQAFLRHTTHTDDTPGAWRKSADTVSGSATATAVPSAYFRSSTSGAGLALLEINLP
jgi:hypothetical protein